MIKLPDPITKLKDVKGRRVRMRMSLNVPVRGRVVEEDSRLRAMVPTLRYLIDKGAKVIGIGHVGRDEDETLLPVVRHMNKFLPVGFLPDKDRKVTKRSIDNMREGSVFILANLRRFPGESAGDLRFAEELSLLGDAYVNDAFDCSHRAHASIVGLPKLLPSYAGLQLMSEMEHLSRVLKPSKPFVVILGGAKIETKIPLMKKLLPKVTKMFVLGALANSFFHEMGYETGKSLIDDKNYGLKKFVNNRKIILPRDVVVKNSRGDETKDPQEVLPEDNMLDIGGATVREIIAAIRTAKFVLWNGPLGQFESGFRRSTEEVAKALAKSGAKSLTISSIEYPCSRAARIVAIMP